VLSPPLFLVHMNCIDSHSQADKGGTVGRCKMNRLLFADVLVPIASSQQGPQHALDRFSAAYDQAGNENQV